MVRIMKKDGNRLEGIGERIDVRLTLIEEALGMTPGDPEIYGNWIASKAPEPEVGEEEVGVIEGMDAVEDATTCFSRTEDGVPFCWDYQIKGFFKDACSSLRRVPGTRSSKLTAFKKVIDGTVFVEQRKIPFRLPEGAQAVGASARFAPAPPPASAWRWPRPRPSPPVPCLSSASS